jgi:hypothetical protein
MTEPVNYMPEVYSTLSLKVDWTPSEDYLRKLAIDELRNFTLKEFRYTSLMFCLTSITFVFSNN